MQSVIKGLSFVEARPSLKFKSLTILELNKGCTNMINVVLAFKELGWDNFAYNPLQNDNEDQDVNRARIQKTISNMNRRSEGIKFSTFDNGKFIRFELTGRAKLMRDKECNRLKGN